ncbi:NAD(P)/FAD-dependent oxidoreductase [Brevibacterium salitolerans]|uniref:NAD(P)/FAD-dependent oxidoreductase n=1 Tax=Brevibacterium salitolerans TaxID=1403566 RepID=A0ABN2WUS8_9MICO
MTTAAVVGSGPNGLAAALTLAAAGHAVTVYEAADVPGGGTRSAELTLPGLLHDECSSHHPLGLDNEFARRFDLGRYGLEWGFTEIEYAHPLDAGGAGGRSAPSGGAGAGGAGRAGSTDRGRGAAVLRSVADTAATLGADGPAYRAFFGPVASRMPFVAEEFLRSMLHVPRHPWALAQLGMRAVLPASAAARLFRTEEARALWAGIAAHTFGPFDRPLSSAIGTSLGSAAHYWGWPVAKGGSQSIARAMIAALEAGGGRVETGRRIDDVRELDDADVIMLDTGPAETARIASHVLSRGTAEHLRRWRHGPAAFKLALAVDGGIPWDFEPASRAGTVHVSGTYAETARAERDAARGRMPERPFILLAQQYLADPGRARGSLVPIDCYAHVPQGYDGDATEAILGQLERFAPGLRERIVGQTALGTAQIERRNPNFTGGDILTGNKDPLQLVLGASPGPNPYRLLEGRSASGRGRAAGTGARAGAGARSGAGVLSTSVSDADAPGAAGAARTGAVRGDWARAARRPGMYLCSAATPPGPGAHGMCGYLAAQQAIEDLDRKRTAR